METATVETAQLPETLFMVVMRYPPPVDSIGPLFLPFPPVGFGLPVFEHREGAEEFVASPKFDVPGYIIKEITLEQFVRGGEYPIDMAREHGDEGEYFYMVDPRPMHEWEGVESMGYLIPMAHAAKLLREEIGE